MLLRTCAHTPLGDWRYSFLLEPYLRVELQDRPTFSINRRDLQPSCPVELYGQHPTLPATNCDYAHGTPTTREAHLRLAVQRFYCGLVICRCLTTCVADLSLQPLQKRSGYCMDQASPPTSLSLDKVNPYLHIWQTLQVINQSMSRAKPRKLQELPITLKTQIPNLRPTWSGLSSSLPRHTSFLPCFQGRPSLSSWPSHWPFLGLEASSPGSLMSGSPRH